MKVRTFDEKETPFDAPAQLLARRCTMCALHLNMSWCTTFPQEAENERSRSLKGHSAMATANERGAKCNLRKGAVGKSVHCR